MRKVILLIIVSLSVLGTSCSEDKLDPNSIFAVTESQKNEFDKWLYENYTKPYNIDFLYRFEHNESDMKYNVTPAAYNQSVALAKLVKYLWIDSYEELLGPTFIRTYCPKVMHLVGSPEYEKSGGSMVLGTAEGGLKITLFNVNGFDPVKPDPEVLNFWYFKTMHHEFAHILHQTKNYPTDFNLISAGKYKGAGWVNWDSDLDALKAGFVSTYASSETQEDFVEVISIYITWKDAAWQKLLTDAGAEGASIINQKWEIAKDWLAQAWGIDLVELHKIVQRRTDNIGTLKLDL